MTIIKPKDVSIDPEVILRSWSIYEIDQDGIVSRHLVGYNILEGMGRVSSPIEEYNKDERTFVTRSGRKYKLEDGPGSNSDSDYVWRVWRIHNSILEENYKDVTHEYLWENIEKS